MTEDPADDRSPSRSHLPTAGRIADEALEPRAARVSFPARVAQSYATFNQIQEQLDGLIAENSQAVDHVTQNWAAAVTPGFWSKLWRARRKDVARRRLTRKFLRALLSVDSNFVMNVETVKAWRDGAETTWTKFGDPEIRALYNTFIALEHDSDFLERLRCHSEFLYYYFLDKVPYIRRHRDMFDGRQPSPGPLEYVRVTELVSPRQSAIDHSIEAASLVGREES